MRIHYFAAAAVSAALAVACGGRKEGPVTTTTGGRVSSAPSEQARDDRDQALIRVVQVIPEAPKADVYAGNNKAFTGVGFGTVTPYKPVAEEHFTLALKPAGQESAKPMIEAKEGLDAGRRYTVLSMPDRDGAAKISVVTDDAAPPASGKAKLRVIHAAPEAGPVDVYAGDATDKKNAILSNVDYGVSGSYKEVEPSTISVRVAPRGHEKGQRPALETQKAELQAGKLYTVIVPAGDKAGKPVSLVKIEDQVANEDGVVPLTTEKEKASTKEANPADDNYEIHPDMDNMRDQNQGKNEKRDQPPAKRDKK